MYFINCLANLIFDFTAGPRNTVENSVTSSDVPSISEKEKLGAKKKVCVCTTAVNVTSACFVATIVVFLFVLLSKIPFYSTCSLC